MIMAAITNAVTIGVVTTPSLAAKANWLMTMAAITSAATTGAANVNNLRSYQEKASYKTRRRLESLPVPLYRGSSTPVGLALN